MTSPAEILDFWFRAHGENDWYAGRPEFDALIVDQFRLTHTEVARGETYWWRSTPGGRLAEIIVLDQFSRQIFRGQGQAFATDGMALVLAQEAVAGGHHHFLEPRERAFVLLPFMHSESGIVQSESVRLHTALGNSKQLQYAQGHAEVIRRFGRFPRRNAALGRSSTTEELTYMAETQGAF